MATSFDVAPDARRLRAPHKIGLAFARSDLSAALAGLHDRDPRPVVALVAGARLSPRNLDRFQKALRKLADSFSAANADAGELYHVNVCLYPACADVDEGRRIDLRLGRR